MYKKLKNIGNKVKRLFYLKIKYIFSSLKTRLKFLFIIFGGNGYFVLGRIACVGQSVYKLTNINNKENSLLINIQKGRMDLLIDWIVEKDNKPIPKLVKPYLKRQDVFPLIEQQSKYLLKLPKKKVKYFIMDSFSDLTDQKFTHKKNKWSFYCHYSDLDHNSVFDNIFECNGLLDISKLEEMYTIFFDWFEKEYPEAKVYFIHYSARFDHRIKFKERAEQILKLLEKLAIKKKYITNIKLDETDYTQNENDDYPYHYSTSTYIKLNDLMGI